MTADDHSPFDLSGRSAVVTGASRGIGEGIAMALLTAGADVIALQRSAPSPQLVQAAAAAGRDLQHIQVDLSDERDITNTANRILSKQTVNILVNNAGLMARHDSVDFPLKDFDDVLFVNLRSVFQLSQEFGRPMVEGGSGKIINIASLLSFQGGLRVPAYAAAKGAVAQLTKALCNEWAGQGVNVNAIAPGYVATDLNEALRADEERNRSISERIPAGRWGAANDLGGAAVFLASAASDYVHGITLPVDGGWLAR